MAEEFQESDVVFDSDYCQNSPTSRNKNQFVSKKSKPKTANYNKQQKLQQNRKSSSSPSSPPMKIPESGIRYYDVVEYDNDDGDGGGDDDDVDGDEEVGCIGGERLPPHLIVARRIGGQMACSFYVEDGNGRILKGRNLCQVRNSILRLTGFYET